MPSVRYSSRALADLREIGYFTLEKWGLDQAEKYLAVLRQGCDLIAVRPHIGRVYSRTRPTWRRLEHQSHIIFYSIRSGGTTIQRILHKGRLIPSTR